MKISFLGGGNMAASLINGLVAADVPSESIAVSHPAQAHRETFSHLGVALFEDNSAAIVGADVVILAVKPQIALAVLRELKSLSPNQLLISICAGLTTENLAGATQGNQPIVRCMPNTPALVGCGMAGLFASNCTDEQRGWAETILGAASEMIWLDEESKLDSVTAVSGSGPAYFFLLMESMIEAGKAQGLSHEQATKLTIQTALGAAQMAVAANAPEPRTLRARVTSKGGTTAAALQTFADAGFSGIVNSALGKAQLRAVELSAEFGE